MQESNTCGLYYKPMTIINDNSRVVNKLEASLTDDDRVVIYDRHMFIVQATVFYRAHALLMLLKFSMQTLITVVLNPFKSQIKLCPPPPSI
jgi:hypothetical protein